jgi:hypothetical protein
METAQKSFKLAIVDETSSSLIEALGMSQERAQELGTKIRKVFVVSEKITQAADIVTADCRHENELLFCYYYIAKLQDQMNNPIEALLKKIGNKE